ncbi:spore coat U domain-containing protein [Hafnia alvei]|uniref:Csu type fimbrial protein n=1 Tax=Hafnia alvei TaxID=569 RepID=UPI002AB2B4FF|nr:spore coat U domain-containing protein [Hafnia alvei]
MGHLSANLAPLRRTSNMRILLTVMTTLVASFFFSPTAHALCTLTKPVIVNYGTQSSVVVNATSQSQTINIQLTCTTVLNIAAPGFINVNFASATPANTPRALLTSSTTTDTIPIQLNCIPRTCTPAKEIQVADTAAVSSATLLTLLSNTQYTLPFTIQTVIGQSVAAGTYTASLNLNISWSICTVGAVGICAIPDPGSDTLSIPITLIVANDCATITAPDINFGSAPVAGSFSTQSGTITLVCTKSATYTVGISDGQNASGGVRNMLNGAANLLSYDIYQSTSNNRWGSVGSQRWSSTAATTSPDTMTKTYSYTAKIFPTQNTPPAGVYNDTLVVDVAF